MVSTKLSASFSSYSKEMRSNTRCSSIVSLPFMFCTSYLVRFFTATRGARQESTGCEDQSRSHRSDLGPASAWCKVKGIDAEEQEYKTVERVQITLVKDGKNSIVDEDTAT